MGNESSKGEGKKPETQSPLSQRERMSLSKFYETIKPWLSSSEENAMNLVNTFRSPILAKCLMASGRLSSYGSCEMLVVQCLKINTTKTLEVFWELIMATEHKVFVFFRMMLQMADVIDENDVTATKLAASVVAFQRFQTSGSYDSTAPLPPVDLNTFKSWMYAYGSCVPNFLQTHILSVFLPDIHNPAFSPFECPILREGSDVVKESALFPLALYAPSLQVTGYMSVYVCMDVRRYVCMNVRVDGRLDVCTCAS
jgi:hypothetical protein